MILLVWDDIVSFYLFSHNPRIHVLSVKIVYKMVRRIVVQNICVLGLADRKYFQVLQAKVVRV